MKKNKASVILTGTDPDSRFGGIGFAMPGYIRALQVSEIEWYSIPTYCPPTKSGKWLTWIKAMPKILKQIKRSKKYNVNVFVYSHAGAGYSLFREYFVLSFSRMLGAKTILQLHTTAISSYLSDSIKGRLLRLAFKPAKSLGVLTPWWKRELLKNGIKNPIYVIPNPLSFDIELLAASDKKITRNREKEGKIVLLSLTRLVPGKGVDLVVEAMYFLPDFYELIIAGDGCMREKYEKRSVELGVSERIRFTGWVSGEEKRLLYEYADIFVLPSTRDSFGMVFIEAMANGLPVIAADWGAIPDVVPNGKCGLLINELNPKKIAETVMNLEEIEKRKKMGKESKKWVLEKYAAEKVGNNIQLMIDDLNKNA